MKKLLVVIFLLFLSNSFADKVDISKMTRLVTNKRPVSGLVKWTGFGVGKTHTGVITLKSGNIELKGSDLIGGTFILDMTSLSTNNSPKLQTHLRSEDFFDVEKFKEANFKITKVVTIKITKDVPATGDNSVFIPGFTTLKIIGDLTIKDKTHPEELIAIVKKRGNGFTATAETIIKDRTQYNIIYNSSKFKAISVLGDKLIKDQIKINLELKTN